MDGIQGTDLANAGLLIARYGDRIRFDRTSRSWYAWNGSVWVPDPDAVVEFAKATVLDLYRAGLDPDDPDRTIGAAAAAKRSMSARSLQAMVTLARSDERLVIASAELDAEPSLLNTPSGIVNLKDGGLRPHDPAALLSRMTAAPYDPRAQCPHWEAGLSRAMGGDAELVAYLQRAFGYAITGESAEQVFHLFAGLGGSGKSTTLDAIRRTLGTYAAVAAAPTFTYSPLARTGAEPELARLMGTRFVSTSEIDGSARLDEARLRSLTGGEAVATRELFRDVIERRPTFKLFLACNAAPQIRENHDGTWRRVRVVRWDAPVSERERDVWFDRRLEREAPGILAWLVRGAVEWYRTGLRPPRQVLDWSAAYRAEQDTLGRFLAESTHASPEAHVEASALYAAYRTWCAAAREAPISQKAFGTALGTRLARGRGPGGRVVYIGCRLR